MEKQKLPEAKLSTMSEVQSSEAKPEAAAYLGRGEVRREFKKLDSCRPFTSIYLLPFQPSHLPTRPLFDSADRHPQVHPSST